MDYTNFDDDDTDFSTLDRGDSYVDDEDQEDQEVEDQEDEEEEDENQDQEDEQEDDEEDEEIEEEVEEPKKAPKIPKGRLDKALRQRDEYKERSLWLEEQLEKLIEQGSKKQEEVKVPELPPYDFEGAEEQYAILLIEGETTKAAKLRREIDNAREQRFAQLLAEIEERAIDKATKTSSAATENAKFQALIENYENKFPFLDSENDLYNEEAVDTVNTLLAGYVAKGMTKSEALKKAVDKVAPMFKKEIETTKKSSKERQIEANKKIANTIKSQPAKTKSSASSKIDTSKLDISKMSERDFAKLTPRELKALRGDY
jgi:hypothetical protein